jgi:hypothetical protein
MIPPMAEPNQPPSIAPLKAPSPAVDPQELSSNTLKAPVIIDFFIILDNYIPFMISGDKSTNSAQNKWDLIPKSV